MIKFCLKFVKYQKQALKMFLNFLQTQHFELFTMASMNISRQRLFEIINSSDSMNNTANGQTKMHGLHQSIS